MTEALPVGTPRGFRAPGTTTMVAGGLLGGILALIFQAVGGRVLGEEGFAPIAAIWTAFFIIASVLFVPLEQYVTRETSRGRALAEDLKVVAWVGGIGIAAGVAYVGMNLDSEIFGGNPVYVAVIGLSVFGYALLFTGKGILAGNRRFADVGWVLIFENGFRLLAGLAILAVVASAASLAWALAVAPFSALLLRFWRHDRAEGEAVPVGARRFLGAYIVGSSASQVLLAGAPLGVDILGGSPALFSIVFWTFTLYRAPLTLIYGLQSRVLPYLVKMGEEGDHAGLRRMSVAVLGGGGLLTVLGAGVGWLVGPEVVGVIFGETGVPAREVAMLAAGGVMAGSTAQVGGQVLVARARTMSLATAWVTGLVVAVLTMLLAAGTADLRVAIGFAAGELVALLMMGFFITRA